MDKVECPGCHRHCVPRLWHYSPFLGGSLRYMKTQHLCPFCGTVMYESGGEINPICWTFAAIFAVIGVWIGSELLFQDAHDKGIIVRSLDLTVKVAFLYGAYRVVRKVFRKPDTKD